MRTRPWPLSVGDLVLREATSSDIDTLLEFRNDPDVNRWTIATREDPGEFRAKWRAIPSSDTDFSCVAERAGDIVAIGYLELIDGLGQPGTPPGTTARIGYLVRPAAAGSGVGSALARGLLCAAFDRIHVRRVTAGVFADNHASVRILHKLGMRREQHGVQDSWHAERGWIDGCQYAMLATEWPVDGQQAGPTRRTW